MGIVEFRAENPTRIWLTTALPRVVLQCLFLTLLGRVAGGEAGERFAFVGAVAAVLTLATLIGVCDVPMLDAWSGTVHRLRLGSVPVPALFLLRAVPWAGEAVVALALSVGVVGPLTGNGDLVLDLLPVLPVYLLMIPTSIAAGLTAAAAAVGRRADVLVGNGFSYLVVLSALVPAGRLPALDAVGTVLPIRHGLAAVRAHLAGRPVLPSVLAEIAVGAGWLAACWLICTVQGRRARRNGADDLA